MKTSTVVIIIVVIGVVSLGIGMFGMGFQAGSSSNQMSDSDIGCLRQYGMTCDEYTADQLKIRPNP